jgi:hypothetical protein
MAFMYFSDWALDINVNAINAIAAVIFFIV